MEHISRQQIAKLVLGYLKSESCKSAFRSFLETSPYLRGYARKIQKRKYFSTRIAGLSLVDIITEYSNIYAIVQERLEATNYFNCSQGKSTLLEQILYLLNRVQYSPPNSPCSFDTRSHLSGEEDENICEAYTNEDFTDFSKTGASKDISNNDVNTTHLSSLPGSSKSKLIHSSETPKTASNAVTDTPLSSLPGNLKNKSIDLETANNRSKNESLDLSLELLSQKLLENREFQEKLAENINKEVIGFSTYVEENHHNVNHELDTVIKTVVQKTEADPIFDRLLSEIIDSAENDEEEELPSGKSISESSPDKDNNDQLLKKSGQQTYSSSEKHKPDGKKSTAGVLQTETATTSCQTFNDNEHVVKSLIAASAEIKTNTSDPPPTNVNNVSTSAHNMVVYSTSCNDNSIKSSSSTLSTSSRNQVLVSNTGLLMVPQDAAVSSSSYYVVSSQQLVNMVPQPQVKTSTGLNEHDIMTMPTVFVCDNQQLPSSHLSIVPPIITNQPVQKNFIGVLPPSKAIDPNSANLSEFLTLHKSNEQNKCNISYPTEVTEKGSCVRTKKLKTLKPKKSTNSNKNVKNKSEVQPKVLQNVVLNSPAPSTCKSELEKLSVSTTTQNLITESTEAKPTPKTNSSHVRQLKFSTPEKLFPLINIELNSDCKKVSITPKDNQDESAENKEKKEKNIKRKASTDQNPVKITENKSWDADLRALAGIAEYKEKEEKMPACKKKRSDSNPKKNTGINVHENVKNKGISSKTNTTKCQGKLHNDNSVESEKFISENAQDGIPKGSFFRFHEDFSNLKVTENKSKERQSSEQEHTFNLQVEEKKKDDVQKHPETVFDLKSDDGIHCITGVAENALKLKLVENKESKQHSPEENNVASKCLPIKNTLDSLIPDMHPIKPLSEPDEKKDKSDSETECKIIKINVKPAIKRKCNIENNSRNIITVEKSAFSLTSNASLGLIDEPDKLVLSPTKLNANKRTLIEKDNKSTTAHEKIVNTSCNKFNTPEEGKLQKNHPVSTAKRNITPNLETPVKGDSLLPKTPSFLSPINTSDTPFTKVLKEQLQGVDLSSLPTPRFPITPTLALTPLDPSPYSKRSTDYSTTSSYYQPSDTEQTKALEQVIIEECKRLEKKPHISTKTNETEKKENPETTHFTQRMINDRKKNFNNTIMGKKNLSLVKIYAEESLSSDESSESSFTSSSDDSNRGCHENQSDDIVIPKKISYALRSRNVTVNMTKESKTNAKTSKVSKGENPESEHNVVASSENSHGNKKPESLHKSKTPESLDKAKPVVNSKAKSVANSKEVLDNAKLVVNSKEEPVAISKEVLDNAKLVVNSKEEPVANSKEVLDNAKPAANSKEVLDSAKPVANSKKVLDKAKPIANPKSQILQEIELKRKRMIAKLKNDKAKKEKEVQKNVTKGKLKIVPKKMNQKNQLNSNNRNTKVVSKRKQVKDSITEQLPNKINEEIEIEKLIKSNSDIQTEIKKENNKERKLNLEAKNEKSVKLKGQSVQRNNRKSSSPRKIVKQNPAADFRKYNSTEGKSNKKKVSSPPEDEIVLHISSDESLDTFKERLTHTSTVQKQMKSRIVFKNKNVEPFEVVQTQLFEFSCGQENNMICIPQRNENDKKEPLKVCKDSENDAESLVKGLMERGIYLVPNKASKIEHNASKNKKMTNANKPVEEKEKTSISNLKSAEGNCNGTLKTEEKKEGNKEKISAPMMDETNRNDENQSDAFLLNQDKTDFEVQSKIDENDETLIANKSKDKDNTLNKKCETASSASEHIINNDNKTDAKVNNEGDNKQTENISNLKRDIPDICLEEGEIISDDEEKLQEERTVTTQLLPYRDKSNGDRSKRKNHFKLMKTGKEEVKKIKSKVKTDDKHKSTDHTSKHTDRKAAEHDDDKNNQLIKFDDKLFEKETLHIIYDESKFVSRTSNYNLDILKKNISAKVYIEESDSEVEKYMSFTPFEIVLDICSTINVIPHRKEKPQTNSKQKVKKKEKPLNILYNELVKGTTLNQTTYHNSPLDDLYTPEKSGSYEKREQDKMQAGIVTSKSKQTEEKREQKENNKADKPDEIKADTSIRSKKCTKSKSTDTKEKGSKAAVTNKSEVIPKLPTDKLEVVDGIILLNSKERQMDHDDANDELMNYAIVGSSRIENEEEIEISLTSGVIFSCDKKRKCEDMDKVPPEKKIKTDNCQELLKKIDVDSFLKKLHGED